MKCKLQGPVTYNIKDVVNAPRMIKACYGFGKSTRIVKIQTPSIAMLSVCVFLPF
jgi:hypothetical protein